MILFRKRRIRRLNKKVALLKIRQDEIEGLDRLHPGMYPALLWEHIMRKKFIDILEAKIHALKNGF